MFHNSCRIQICRNLGQITCFQIDRDVVWNDNYYENLMDCNLKDSLPKIPSNCKENKMAHIV